jgi:hypothetical protein
MVAGARRRLPPRNHGVEALRLAGGRPDAGGDLIYPPCRRCTRPARFLDLPQGLPKNEFELLLADLALQFSDALAGCSPRLRGRTQPRSAPLSSLLLPVALPKRII